MFKFIEVASKTQIMFESKAQADEKAQHTCEYVSILKRLQRSYRTLDGVLKSILGDALDGDKLRQSGAFSNLFGVGVIL